MCCLCSRTNLVSWVAIICNLTLQRACDCFPIVSVLQDRYYSVDSSKIERCVSSFDYCLQRKYLSEAIRALDKGNESIRRRRRLHTTDVQRNPFSGILVKVLRPVTGKNSLRERRRISLGERQAEHRLP